jgi:hypothetical protein
MQHQLPLSFRQSLKYADNVLTGNADFGTVNLLHGAQAVAQVAQTLAGVAPGVRSPEAVPLAIAFTRRGLQAELAMPNAQQAAPNHRERGLAACAAALEARPNDLTGAMRELQPYLDPNGSRYDATTAKQTLEATVDLIGMHSGRKQLASSLFEAVCTTYPGAFDGFGVGDGGQFLDSPEAPSPASGLASDLKRDLERDLGSPDGWAL